MAIETISSKPPIEVDINDDPSRLLTELRELPDLNLTASPYMLIRPTGMYFLEQIKQLAEAEGLVIKQQVHVADFETLARYIYPVNPDKEMSYLWLMIVQAAAQSNKGVALIVDNSSMDSYEKIVNFKYKVREAMGGRTPYRANYQGRQVETTLHHIHVPDEDSLSREFNALMHFIEES